MRGLLDVKSATVSSHFEPILEGSLTIAVSECQRGDFSRNSSSEVRVDADEGDIGL